MCLGTWIHARTLGICAGILEVCVGDTWDYCAVALGIVFGARIHETRIWVLGVCNTIVTSEMLLNVM